MGTGTRISELRETHWANFSTVGPEAVTEVNSRMKSNGRMASFLFFFVFKNYFLKHLINHSRFFKKIKRKTVFFFLHDHRPNTKFDTS